MSIVRTFCDKCGDIRIGPESIVLEADMGDADAVCVITCPQCHVTFRKPANDALYAMLTAIGVPVRFPAAEVCDGGAPPFTHADLLQFRAFLESDDFLARTAAG